MTRKKHFSVLKRNQCYFLINFIESKEDFVSENKETIGKPFDINRIIKGALFCDIQIKLIIMSIRKKNGVRHKAFYLTLSYCIFISKSNLVLECQDSFCWWNSDLFFNYISSCNAFLFKWQMGILTHGCFNFDANKVNRNGNDKHKSALTNRIYSIGWSRKWLKIHPIHFHLFWNQTNSTSSRPDVLKTKLHQVYNLNYHCYLI